MKKIFFSIVIITGISFSCTEVEEPLIDNPYDPQYVSTNNPSASISSSISDGDKIATTDASFSWSGSGGESSEFAYMLEGIDDDFSAWSSDKTVNYSYLDEGSYTFLVKERYANLDEQETASSRKFTVNAITDFALFMEKYKTNASLNENFSLNVNVEQTDDLNGLSTVIEYNADRVTFVSAEKATNVSGISNIEILYKELSNGRLELNILLLGTNGGFSGNATLCTLNFKSESDNNSEIGFDTGATIARDDINRNQSFDTFRSATVN